MPKTVKEFIGSRSSSPKDSRRATEGQRFCRRSVSCNPRRTQCHTGIERRWWRAGSRRGDPPTLLDKLQLSLAVATVRERTMNYFVPCRRRDLPQTLLRKLDNLRDVR